MEPSARAPIDVDGDSDATLSSKSDVEMEDVAAAAPARETASARGSEQSPGDVSQQLQQPPPQESSAFSQSTAAARNSLLLATQMHRGEHAAAIEPSSAHRHPVVTAQITTNGKKRRLSSPPLAPRKQDSTASTLDFRLHMKGPRSERTMQVIDDDEEEDEEEESKGNDRPVPHEEHQIMLNQVKSTRTWVCGKWFGRCVLHFHPMHMELALWTLPDEDGSCSRVFKGSFRCPQLKRFSLSRGSAPYFAILEVMRDSPFQPMFTEFYDRVFASVTAISGPSIEPDIYGAVLFFDDDLELARCQSMGDITASLRQLMESPTGADEDATIRALKCEMTTSTPPKQPNRSPPLKLRQAKLSEAVDNSDMDSMSSRFRTSSRRKSLLLQPSKDVEEVVQNNDSTTEPNNHGMTPDASELNWRSTRAAARLLRLQLRQETEKLEAERKSKLLLSYPFEGADRAGQISIMYGDIDRLRPGEFLNDTIIDFYLRYLWRHIELWQQHQVYFFSSHFFTQLSGGNLSSSFPMLENRFARVARWTQKENLFEKRFLFIPINDSCHWSIAVLCNPGSAIIRKRRKQQAKKAHPSPSVDLVGDANDTVIIDTTEEASDSEEEDEHSTKERMNHPPCVLFLDSLRCHQKKKICTLLRCYMEYEFRARENKAKPERTYAERDAISDEVHASFDLDAIKLIEPEIPLQSNSSDCGVFLLMYTAQILRAFPAGVTQEDVNSKLASSLTREMFDDTHVQEFRDYLHQLVFTLQKIQQRGGTEYAIASEGLEFFAVE